MDTQTLLCTDVRGAEELIGELKKAITDARNDDGGFARVVLEQSDAKGPWRLIISIGGSGE